VKFKWNRELAVRKHFCVVCGESVKPREKPLVRRYRGRPIILCSFCEKLLGKRIEIEEDPIFTVLR